MILVLRGHIRSSFNTPTLKMFVYTIQHYFPDLKIYLHTWNKVQSSLSYRKMDDINDEVTEDKIVNYFGSKISQKIKHIIIDDDTIIYNELIGKKEGQICRAGPLLPWKFMWYGKHKILKYLYTQTSVNKDECVINTRYDYFSNPFHKNKNSVIEFIKSSNNVTEIRFQVSSETFGCDNVYCGPLSLMYKLSDHFHYNLEYIMNKWPTTNYQEFLVYYERNSVNVLNDTMYTFIHPTKTGGTFIGNILNKHFYNIFNKDSVFGNHSHLIRCSNTIKSVVTIRNPINRFISMYNYWKNGSELNFQTESSKNITIKEFINMIKQNDAELMNNYIWDLHYKPQSYWINDVNKNNVIVLINDETNLIHKLKCLIEYIGVPFPNIINEHRTNVSIVETTIDKLDSDDIEFIKSQYTDDFNLYNLAIEHPEEFKKVF